MENSSVRDYIFELIKVIESAANFDQRKTLAYAQQLCDKLEAAGEAEVAKRLRNALVRSKSNTSAALASRVNSHTNGSLPVESEFRLAMATEEFFEKGSAEVVLSQSTRTAVAELISHFKESHRFVSHGVAVSSSMLLYGPPGCGKTHTAKFISSELGMPLITARMDAIISSYLGSTAKNLRLLFEHFASRPCILFLDELDAIGKMRDDVHELGELKRVVISLLQNIDALDHEHIILAATNHEHLLDPAIWRRFTYHLELSLPDYAARTKMLKAFFGKFGSDEVVDAAAALTESISGATLRQIAENSIRAAILKNQSLVSVETLLESFATIHGGHTSTPQLTQTEKIKKLRQSNPKRFTQSYLAQLFGISQSTVNRLVREM